MNVLPENVTAFLIGADYNGQKKCARLIFYEPLLNKLFSWNGENHDPYCLTNLSPFELEKISALMKHPSLKRLEMMTKFDALKGEDIIVTKVITSDPKAIGSGKPTENIRDIIPAEGGGKVWEARIPYSSCYIYDKNIEMGMPYCISESKKLQPIRYLDAEERIKQITEQVKVTDDRWVRLCEYPVPEFLRVALDIEVLGAGSTRVPDPTKAEYPIISVCLIGTDGKRKVLLLLREGTEIGTDVVNASLEFFVTELDLIKTLFNEIKNYPFVITFNGDNFDLSYLYYRAIKLGMAKEEVPILLSKHGAKVRDAIHIDLYRFFFNRSLRNYAFSGKYKNVALDEIAMALLGKGKLHSNENIWLATEMRIWTYTQLAKYNCQDGDVTLELTTYDESLVMKLIMVLMRISMMSMEDLIRSPISFWIRSMLFYEHRRRNYLIPNPEDIYLAKGKAVTEAVIKGKKYKGAIVIEPSAGIHFDVDVVDFASLYPSILKDLNLGYQSIRCEHEECKSNLIPQTSHWVCKKTKAMEGEIIGLLRDLRVFHYKKLKKDPYYGVVEQAIKVLLNASYGVFGDEDFDLYCPPISESVTAMGRHSITSTIEKAKEFGIEILYGDTDSIFLKNPTKEQLESLTKWSTQTLGLDLEVDKHYRYVCLSSRKKNYLGVQDSGEVDVKGLTGKKKHTPPIIKGAFNVAKKYFGEAKTPEEVEALKIALKKVILDIYLRIKRRDFTLEEVAFNMTLGKSPMGYEKTIPQHVKAAKMLEGLGIFLKKGDAVFFVKCHGKEVKPIQLAKKEDIDVTKYHEMLRSTFEQVLDALEIDFDKIIGVVKLESFF